MRLVLPFLFCLLSGLLNAQSVQWADTVLDWSTQLGEKQHGAIQVLGEPNAPLDGSSSPVAWTPEKPASGQEHIKVGFAEPIFVSQVTVVESATPGSISRIWAYDSLGNEVAVKKLIPIKGGKKRRILQARFKQTTFKVHAIRLDLNTLTTIAHNEIDAIGISSEPVYVNVEINLAKGAETAGKPENLGPTVNSELTEGACVVTADGRALYFTRENHPKNEAKQTVWYSLMNPDGSWSEAKPVGPPVNNHFNNNPWSIQPGGNAILFQGTYRMEKHRTRGYFLSGVTETGWSEPTRIRVRNYYNRHKFSGMRIGADGKTLIMEVERDDTFGDRDIYVSFMLPDGTFSIPLNLGPDVNTAALEASPFLAADMKTLYFASEGYPGYGARDIFVTRRLDSTWTKWSKPENLGPEINSDGWDGYYTITASGDYAYLAREGGYGLLDIYRVLLPEQVKPEPVVLIKGRVLNKKTNEPIGATIAYEDLKTGKEVGTATSNPTTGGYQIVLPYGREYGFRAESPGFVGINENLNLTEIDAYREIDRDLFLVPVEVGQTVRLNNIWFDFAKATLRPESFPELDRVVKFMQQNTSVTIELSGHTDNKGADDYNLQLSDRRAQAVTDYLIKKGVNTARVTPKGYGESKPVAPNDTDEHRQLNRRVEFTILTE